MRIKALWRLSVVLLAVGTIGAIGGIEQTLAQTEVSPGTRASFVPADIDGSFYGEFGDCGVSQILCRTAADVNAGKAYTYTASIANTTLSATTVSGLYKQFTIPLDGEETILDARVSGGASWRGSFYVVDFTKIDNWQLPSLGAKAEGFVRVSLVDVTDSTNPFDVGNDAIEDFSCDPGREMGGKIPIPLVSDGVELAAEIGWCEEERSETFSFPAKVVTGRTYELQLSMVCQSTTGFPLTILSLCTFNNGPEFNLTDLVTDAMDDIVVGDISIPQETIDLDFIGELKFPPDALATIPLGDIFADVITPVTEAILDAAVPNLDAGFLAWDYMNIAVAPNLSALVRNVRSNVINGVQASEATITTAVEGVGDDVEVVRTGVAESIRLLHTPSGRRESGPIDGYPDLCGDGQCD